MTDQKLNSVLLYQTPQRLYNLNCFIRQIQKIRIFFFNLSLNEQSSIPLYSNNSLKQKLTELSPVSTVYVEGLVTFVDLPDGGVEHQTVWAQLGGGHAVHTLVELVTLDGVLVLSILVGAFELCTWGRWVG